MPYAQKQVRYLMSKGTPLTAKQQAKLRRELHENPGMIKEKKDGKTKSK